MKKSFTVAKYPPERRVGTHLGLISQQEIVVDTCDFIQVEVLNELQQQVIVGLVSR